MFSHLIKKISIGALIIGFALSSLVFLFSPQQAAATPDFDDFTNTMTTVLEGAESPLQFWHKAKEAGLDKIAYQLAQQLAQKMTSSLLNWANSGFEGNPFFVDSPVDFFENTVFTEASFVASGLKEDLETGFNYQALVALGEGFLDDAQSEFTLDKVIGDDWVDYAEGDFKTGGYPAWYAQVFNDANSAYGKSLQALTQASNAAEKALEEKKEELLRNAGFQDEKKCENELELFDGSKYCTRYSVTTPGDTIRSGVALGLEQPFNKLAEADEFGEILATSLSQLVNGLTDIGLSKIKGAITASVSGGSSAQGSFENIIDVSNQESPNGLFDQGSYETLGEPYDFNFENTVEFNFIEELYGAPEPVTVNGLPIVADVDSREILFASSSNMLATFDSGPTSPFSYLGQTVQASELDYELIRITEDTNDYFDHDYYYINGEFIYDAVIDINNPTDANITPLIPAKNLGAIEALTDVIASTEAQQSLILDIGELTNKVDRECLLGPDLGYEQRYNEVANRVIGDEENKEIKRNLNYISQFLIHSLKEMMRNPVYDNDKYVSSILPDEPINSPLYQQAQYKGSQFASMIDDAKIIVSQSTRHHRKYFTNEDKLSEWYGLLSQIEGIETRYQNALSDSEKDEQVEKLFSIIQEQKIPTAQERTEAENFRQQLQDEAQDTGEFYNNECQEQLAQPEFAFPIFLDKLEILYCPLEHEADRIKNTGWVRDIRDANYILNSTEPVYKNTNFQLADAGDVIGLAANISPFNLFGGIEDEYVGHGGIIAPGGLGINWSLYEPFFAFPRTLVQFFDGAVLEEDPDTGLRSVNISSLVEGLGGGADATNRNSSRSLGAVGVIPGLKSNYTFDYWAYGFKTPGEDDGEITRRDYLQISCGDFYRAPIQRYLPITPTGI